MAKRGAKKKDYRGFDNVISRMKEAIKRKGMANLIYVKGKGFIVRNKILFEVEQLIECGKAELVGVYVKGVDFFRHR